MDHLNLVFHTNVYRGRSMRDTFTSLVNDPLGTLLPPKDHLHVIRDVAFEIKRGERVGLLGVNGSGKTTLCRCVAGMYAPTTGRLYVRGKVRAVFDTRMGIQPELTGRENALLLSRFMFPEESDPTNLVDDAIAFSELGHFADTPYRIYSNGMQARLCLSLISSKPADLLILDEVFDGADAFFKDKIATRVMRMIEASGAIIFVSHSMDQIKQVCNRLLVLHEGRLAYDGAVEEGLRFYESLGAKR